MLRSSLLSGAILLLAGSVAIGREWTDSTGKFKQEGDLVDFDGHLVVLKKGSGQLVALAVDKLSKKDQEFLASKPAKEEMKACSECKDRTWTMKNGTTVKGKVLKYGRRDVTITRKDSKLLANDIPWSDLDDWRKYALLQVVSQGEGKEFKTEKQVESLLVAQKGKPLVYPVAGVMLELETGEPFPAPFFLFSEKDLTVLEPGWKAWLAAEKDEQTKEDESTMLRNLANEYQKNKAIEHRIQLLRAASDWFDLWEVVVTANGQMARVVVPARDSLTAEMLALKKYPGAGILSTRILSRRN